MIDKLISGNVAPVSPGGVVADAGPLWGPGATVAPSGAAGPSAASGATAAGADFGAMLGNMMMNAANAVKTAEATSISGITGQASVQQVVEAVMSAEQNLQSALAVRDKVVSAYLEISRMQI